MGWLGTVPARSLFISWVRHSTRSSSLAQGLGAECHFIHAGQRLGLLKYFPRAWKTWRLLTRRRPALVICMNPPYFLPLVAAVYTWFYRARFILDSHSAAFDMRKWTWLRPLHAFAARRAALSIVTNEALCEAVRALGGEAFRITDIPYTLPAGSYPLPAAAFTIVFVCTYAPDEPLAAVFEAARGLADVNFYVTGDARKADPALRATQPKNLVFTGYLSNEEYAGLLRAADALMVLTTRDFTMQRGGSEAISVGRPLITSDWPILRQVFSKGTLHVDNSAESIRAAVGVLRGSYERYRREIHELANERQASWVRTRAELVRRLPELQEG
jgi:glycosyltransferase involved in cell wall biosynthesis